MKTLLLILFSTSVLLGQIPIKTNYSESKLLVLGTSTVHDWESEVGDFSVNGQVGENAIQDLKVEVTVKSIKSGKGIMDDKTYEALKAKTHPKIVFSASTLTRTGSTIKGPGKLTIGGETRDIVLEAKTFEKPGNVLQITGAVTLLMTEWNIDPPTAMFGSLTTGDQVTIKYDLILNN